MSSFSYGSVSLSNILTHGVTQEPVYDDLSGLDYLYTKITVSIQATFNNALPPFAAGDVNAAATVARVRHALALPRQTVVLQVNGVNLVNISGPDAKNGPIPKHIDVKEIAGSETVLVDFSVECAVVECTSGVNPAYSSHRYRETVTIDENFYSRKTRSGKIIVRGDKGTNPDTLRNLIVPPIPQGFKRESTEWTIQEDGLAALYTIVDKEVYLQPPSPATKASGHYIESSPQPGGIRYAECRVALEGPKPMSGVTGSGDRGALLSQAILMAVTKVRGPNGFLLGTSATNGTAKLESATVREELFDNKVEVVIRVQMLGDTSRLNAVPFNPVRFNTSLPGSEPGTLPPDPGTRGSAQLLLQAVGFIDPCSRESVLSTVIPTGSSTLVGAGSNGNTEPIQVSLVPVLPTDYNSYWCAIGSGGNSVDLTPGIYDHYRVVSAWKQNRHVHQMAVANSASAVDSVTVQLAKPQTSLTVTWSAEKSGSAPMLPHPYINDPNATLMHYEFDSNDPEPASDGTAIVFKRTGVYHYTYQQRATQKAAALSPMVNQLVAQAAGVPITQFAHGIIDAALSGGNGTGDAEFQLDFA